MPKKNKIVFNKNFKYCFFTRNGGVSKKNFSTLNCAYNKGDEDKNVKKNREYVLKKFDGENLNRFIEGSHYQTDNDYHIYIYHRQTGESYDRLIGIQKLTSKDLL